MENINILGISISNISRNELWQNISRIIAENSFCQLVTANPEIILKTRNNEEYFHIVNNAELTVPDGFGLTLAGLFMGKRLTRHTGADLTLDLLDYAKKNSLKIAIVNWTKGLSQRDEIIRAIHRKFPDLKMEVFNTLREEESWDTKELSEFRPDICLVALGAPWQEKYIYAAKGKVPGLKIAIGIGGSLDFLTGKIKRAPQILRRSGLEWVWRLLKQPRAGRKNRLKRIFNAVFVFMYAFLRWRLILPYKYRPNIACLLFKKTEYGPQILMVERSDEIGHWQIPQGGLDNLKAKEAGEKELREELNTQKFKTIKTTGFIHKYDFPAKNVHRGALYTRHGGYKGQKQALLIAEFFGNDQDIKINYWDHKNWSWVPIDQAISKAHEKRRPSLEIFIEFLKQSI